MIAERTAEPGEAPVTKFSVLGQPVALRSNFEQAHEAFRNLYRRDPGRTSDASPYMVDVVQLAGAGANDWEAIAANLPARREPTLGDALQRAEAAFCIHALQYATDRVGLHAATIQFGDKLALISGDSGAGKTTLTLALSARGRSLDGDDVATLDPESGLVQGLPRCFHLDDASIAMLLEQGLDVRQKEGFPGFLTPADVGDAGMRPREVAAVFFLRADSLAEPRLTQMTLAEAVVEMEGQSGPRHRPSSELYRLIARMLQRASCFDLRRGPLSATADLIEETMRGVQP